MQRRDFVAAGAIWAAMTGGGRGDGGSQLSQPPRPRPVAPAGPCAHNRKLSAAEKRDLKRRQQKAKAELAALRRERKKTEVYYLRARNSVKEAERVAEQLSETRAQNEADRRKAAKRIGEIERSLRRGKDGKGRPLSEAGRRQLQGERDALATKERSLKAFDADLKRQARDKRKFVQEERNRVLRLKRAVRQLQDRETKAEKKLRNMCH